MMNNPTAPQNSTHLIEKVDAMVSTVVHIGDPMTSYAVSNAIRTGV